MRGSDNVHNEADLEWQEERSPEGTARRYRKKLSAASGGRDLGCSLYRMPPGVRPWPRHYHCANEEAIYVLSGTGAVRIGEDTVALRSGDYVALPVGEGHAHQVVNDSEADLVFLCLSTMTHPDVCVYPDSGKVGVFAGAAPGGPAGESTLKVFVPLAADTPYWENEP